MARGVPGSSSCDHPREEKRKYVHPRTGKVEFHCRICHRLQCRERRARSRASSGTTSYYKHYDVQVYVQLARKPWRR